MVFQVDASDGDTSGFDESLLNGSGLTHKAHHQPVVIFVCPVVEENTSGSPAERVDDRFDDLGTPAFTVVGYAFNELALHSPGSPSVSSGFAGDLNP
jgi:hypothetical protein